LLQGKKMVFQFVNEYNLDYIVVLKLTNVYVHVKMDKRYVMQMFRPEKCISLQ